MNHTLIGKNLAYGAKAGGGDSASPSELANGAIGAFGFDTAGDFVLVDESNVLNFKEIVFYLGLGNGKARQSVAHMIKGNCVASKHPFRAATKTEVVLSGFNVPENDPNCCYKTPPTGFLKIGEDVPTFMSYGNVYYADAGNVSRSATAEQVRDVIYTQLKAKFDASGEGTVTKPGTGTSSTIKIVFNDPKTKYYYVAADGFLAGLVATWTYGDIGMGTELDVVPKEYLDTIYRGDFYTTERAPFGIYKVPSQYVAGTEYNGVYLKTVNATGDKTGQKALTTTEVHTWLYAPEGSDASTTLDAIVDAINAGAAVGPTGPQGPQGDVGPQGPQG